MIASSRSNARHFDLVEGEAVGVVGVEFVAERLAQRGFISRFAVDLELGAGLAVSCTVGAQCAEKFD